MKILPLIPHGISIRSAQGSLSPMRVTPAVLVRNIRLIGVAWAILLLAGCVSVPQTMIQFNPRTNTLIVESPKDVELHGLRAVIHTNGIAEITVESYASRNNFEVVKSVVEAQAAMNADLTANLKGLLETAIKAAAK